MPSSLLSSLLLIFFSLIHLAFAYEENPRGYECENANNSTYNSAFSTNLDLALDSLQNNTAATGFATTTISTSSRQVSVTALALCRGTLNSSDCQICIDAAVLGIRRICSNKTAAQVWYTYCMIRYSSYDFIYETNTSVSFMLFDTRDVPDAYFPTINVFMQNLSFSAGESDKKYAIAMTREPDNQPVYGYMDCSRDVDGENCTNCLLFATSQISSCCLGKWAGWIATPTCNIQFHMEPVHQDWETAPYLDVQAQLTAPPPETNKAGVSPPPDAKTDASTLPSDRPPNGTGRGRVLIGVLAAVIGTIVLIVGGFIYFVVKGRKRAKLKPRRCKFVEDHGGEIKIEDLESGSVLYNLDVLEAATDHFSDSNLLGKGGFGIVYKGKTTNGEEIAVKKLVPNSVQGEEEFSTEVRLLLKVHHRNLVQLLGCCVQGEERILVYEYLPNKSLDHFLFDKSKSAVLDWEKRYNIILGVARGLLYLHQDSTLKIVHRDIKASNILLDQQMNAKISDFGLAKLFTDEQSYIRTRRIAGTVGYMAPEYAIRGHLSSKSDVFSFGVLLLEIISGRRNFDPQLGVEKQELLKLTWKLEQEGRLKELVDVTVGPFPQEIIVKWLRIGLLCAQECIQDRPMMSSALVMLSSNSSAIPLPGRPGYHGYSTVNSTVSHTSNTGANIVNHYHQCSSGNSITNSLASGR